MTGAELYPAFLEAYPEFANVPQSAAEMQLELAAAFVCQSALGKWWQHAVFLLAAHRLALRYPLNDAAQDAGLNPGLASSATVTSISASTSSLSQTIGQSSKTNSESAQEADLARTNYGLEYLALLETIAPMACVVISRW